jgi:hypothetical protein
MSTRNYIVQLKFTITKPKLKSIRLTQEHLIIGSEKKLWGLIQSKIGNSIVNQFMNCSHMKAKVLLSSILLLQCNDNTQSNDPEKELPNVFHWQQGDKEMPDFKPGIAECYFKRNAKI